MTTPLDVDGPRPAVTWVSSLPRDWTTTRERFVLMLLAADSWATEAPFECSPSLSELAAWTGEYKGRIAEAIDSLLAPTSARPALLSKRPGVGRQRTRYTLLVDTLWSAVTDRYDAHETPTDTPLWSGSADHYDDSQAVDNTRSGPASGPRSGPGCGPGERTTPFPSLPTQPTSEENPRQTARDDLAAARARRAAGGTTR